jgi:hypothetical protein
MGYPCDVRAAQKKFVGPLPPTKFFSLALLALWQLVHIACQLLLSQNSPPNRTG